jgi:hypothetical protein
MVQSESGSHSCVFFFGLLPVFGVAMVLRFVGRQMQAVVVMLLEMSVSAWFMDGPWMVHGWSRLKGDTWRVRVGWGNRGVCLADRPPLGCSWSWSVRETQPSNGSGVGGVSGAVVENLTCTLEKSGLIAYRSPTPTPADGRFLISIVFFGICRVIKSKESFTLATCTFSARRLLPPPRRDLGRSAATRQPQLTEKEQELRPVTLSFFS